jgi:hypothetical protein
MVNKIAGCLEDYRDEVKRNKFETQKFRRGVEATLDLVNMKVCRIESKAHSMVTATDIVAVTVVLFFATCFMLSVLEKSLLREIKVGANVVSLPETNFLKCYTELHDFLAKATYGKHDEYYSVSYVYEKNVVMHDLKKAFVYQATASVFNNLRTRCGDYFEGALESHRVWLVANNLLSPDWKVRKFFPSHSNTDVRIQWEPVPEDIKKFL